MKVIWFPIENLEERYSGQWNRWFNSEFERLRIENLMLYGATLSESIRQGSFLDVVGTNYFKADQLKQFCFLFDQNMIKENDIILVQDGWFPGIEMLAYIRDALGFKFKIWSVFHAGTYDPYDFLTQRGMRKWGKSLEKSWFEIYDGIFVATEFHKQLILQQPKDFHEYQGLDEKLAEKIHVTGLPIYPEFVNPEAHKENIIVFPHRLDPEKQPEMFQELQAKEQGWYFGWNMVRTKDLSKTKQEYYNLLNKSKISVSCALQETWGIAMQESVMCGCVPLVPNRLSYKEMYPDIYRYDSYEELRDKIKYFTKYYGEFVEILRMESLKQSFIQKGAEAIPNMVKIMMEN